MHLLALVAESALWASIAGYGSLAAMAIVYHDGRVWGWYRAHLVCDLVGAIASLIALRHVPHWPSLPGFVVGLALLSAARLIGSLCSIVLSLHLHRMLRPTRHGGTD